MHNEIGLTYGYAAQQLQSSVMPAHPAHQAYVERARQNRERVAREATFTVEQVERRERANQQRSNSKRKHTRPAKRHDWKRYAKGAA